MIDPAKQTGAFAPIAKQIAEDADKLTDKDENWTAHARKLDQMSLKAYLEQFRGKTEDWAIDLLDVAYNIEFGLLTEDQSSLAHGGLHRHRYEQAFSDVRRERRGLPHQGRLVGADQGSGGRAREQGRYAAGRTRSTALDTKGGQIVASFDAPEGTHSESFDAVILALAIHQAAAGQGSGASAARSGKAEDHSRARLRDRMPRS